MADLWTGTRPLLLASASAARRGLLAAAGLAVEAVPAGIDERALEAELAPRGLSPAALAAALAAAKARAVSARRPEALVIGADQVLSCDGAVFAKPPDPEAARRQIASLSGRTHRLHAAVALAADGEVVDAFADEARLTMRALDDAAIGRYVALAGEAATRSVGGYEIEGLGIHLFARVEGDHATILGLPLLPLLARLRDLGGLAI